MQLSALSLFTGKHSKEMEKFRYTTTITAAITIHKVAFHH